MAIRYHTMDRSSNTNVQQFNRMLTNAPKHERWRKQQVEELLNGMNQRGIRISSTRQRYTERDLKLVERYYNETEPGRYRFHLFDSKAVLYGKPVYKGPEHGEVNIPLYSCREHFEGIRCINSFLSARNYCYSCEQTYDNDKEHTARCKIKCKSCCLMGKGPCSPQEGYKRTCTDCLKYFLSPECYTRHLERRVCDMYKRCKKCGKVYDASRPDRPHRCYMRYCFKCTGTHAPGDHCYVQKIAAKGRRDPYRIICYDFETTTHTPNKGMQLHKVNFVGAYLYCTRCIDADSWRQPITGLCPVCGPMRKREWYWRGERPLKQFSNWLLRGHSDDIKTIVLAHNGGRYDHHILLGELYKKRNFGPELTRKGEKIYQIHAKRKKNVHPNLIFRDTLNWMPMALAAMPKALGLEVQDKGWFPYLWNKEENLNIHLRNLPPREYYNPDGMKQDKLEAFEEWYEANAVKKKTPFKLRWELKLYCMNDVRILAHAVVKFRDMFFRFSGDDMVENSMTIAGACIRHFCINYLKDQQIAIIPENGYRKMDRQSAKALKYLKWLEFYRSITIRTRDSVDGEYRLGGNIKLDGHVQGGGENGRDLCIEVNGCAWHGHHCLFEDDEMCPNGKTALANREEYDARRKKIEETMDFELVWECEIDEQLRRDEEMRKFFEKCHETGPLNPKDAYFGGRTGPLSLKCDLTDGAFDVDDYEISNLDIISLYPEQNFWTEYPIGHPSQILEKNTEVEWTLPEHNPYKGMIKVFIVPPTDLLVPVVPKKYSGKLMFPLCHTCALDSDRRSKRRHKKLCDIPPNIICPHLDDEQRGFVATLTHLELNLALEKGYRVTRFYSAYVWEEWSNTLFRSYIQDFMKLKVEASGWPAECKDNDEKKAEYLRVYKERFGIEIDPDKVIENAALKYFAKM